MGTDSGVRFAPEVEAADFPDDFTVIYMITHEKKMNCDLYDCSDYPW